jgi:hypothetical protein
MFLIYAALVTSFPLRTDFAVSGTFLFPPLFFYDPLIIEQRVIQSPIVCVFSAATFVVEF